VDFQDRYRLAAWVMDYALQRGADEVGVNLINTEELEIECRDGKIDRLEQGIQNLLYIELYKDNRFSVHKSTLLKKNYLKGFIDTALTFTIYLEKDVFRSLPDKNLYPVSPENDLKLYDTRFNRITLNQKINLVSHMENISLNQDNRIIAATALFSEECFHIIKMHSNGFKGENHTTSWAMGSEVTAKDKNNKLIEDSYYAYTRFFKDLPSPEKVGKEAVKRCLQKIGQSKMTSDIYFMVVENSEVSTLLGMIFSGLQGSALFLRSSYLEGRKNQKIASEKLTVTDDPFMRKGLRSGYFDSEGCATHKRIIVDHGILKEYYIDTYYGKKLGMEPTTGDRSNILFNYGKKSPQELMAEIGRGIFVTDFIGGNFNSTTGDFSVGIIGFFFEKEKIVKPVNEMNITGNALTLWQNLIEVGNDPYQYSSIQAPCLVFKEVFFSGE